MDTAKLTEALLIGCGALIAFAICGILLSEVANGLIGIPDYVRWPLTWWSVFSIMLAALTGLACAIVNLLERW
jgi:hypothetical protein